MDETIRFAHLSDLHVRIDHSKSGLKSIFCNLRNPNSNLKDVLKQLGKYELDFIIISGDLVHEGNLDDYKYLKEVLDTNSPKVPVLLAVGNHDRKDNFKDVFFNGKTNSKTYYSTVIKGLRIIVLDSALPGKTGGFIGKEQLAFLKDILSSPAAKGSILVCHHPLIWDPSFLSIENSGEVLMTISGSDIRGIFCGHTHFNKATAFHGIIQSTAESLAFGFDYDIKNIFFSDRCGFNLCSVDKTKIAVHYENLKPKTKIIKAVSLDSLKCVLKQNITEIQ